MGNKKQDKVELVFNAGQLGKKEDGSVLGISAFAEKYNLPFDERTKSPQYQEYGEDKIGWGYNEKTGEMFTSAVVPNNLETPIDYLKGMDSLDPANAKHSDIVKYARRLYLNEGIVTNAVNVHIDNAVTDRSYITNVNNEECEKMLNAWIRNVNYYSETEYAKADKSSIRAMAIRPTGGIEDIFQQAIQMLLVDGDWVANEIWRDVDVPEVNKKMALPIRIITYDNSVLEFSDAAATLGLDLIYYRIPSKVKDAIKAKKKTEEQKVIFDNLPKWLKSSSDTDKVLLPAEFTTHIKRKGLDYEPNGKSYIQPFLVPVADKMRLRVLDRSVIAGLVQRLTIVMLGHDDVNSELHIPDPAKFSLLKNMLKVLKTNHFMVWGGHDIDVLDIGPDSKILGLKERYNEVNDDLQKAAGIPRLLIDGSSSGTSGRDFSAFISTISKIEVIRRQLKMWADRKLREICVENNFKDEFPEFNFRLLNLRDERTLKQLILKAYEIGLTPRRRTLYEIGLDGDKVVNEHLKEVKEKLNEKIGAPPVGYGVNKSGNRTANPTQDESPGRPAESMAALEEEISSLLETELSRFEGKIKQYLS